MVMRYKRFLLTCAMLFVIALAWNAVLHFVLFAKINAIVRPLYRPNLEDKIWLSLLLTAGVVTLFVIGHQRFTRSSSIREGAKYGLFFAAIAGLLVDLNQYVLYPIPGPVALLWFLGGLIEFTLYGVLTSKLLSKPSPESPSA